MPEGGYPGAYVIPVARDIASRDGRLWLDLPEENWLEPFREEGVAAMMRLVREDLAALGVHHQVFTSERSLIEAGAIEAVLAELEADGLIYTGTLPPPKGKPVDDWEPVPQLLFRSTAYGDEIDRPLKRSNGAWTYFAADVAYHRDKLRRGFPLLIDVLGADHGGYVKRMQAATTAVTGGQGSLDAKICQLVHLLQNGEPVKMSKRAGTFVTLRDVIEQVGRDVVRFIMLTRRNDQTLEFDFAKVTEQSKDNPVFYVQYAHARCRSVLRHAQEADPARSLAPEDLAANAVLARLSTPEELELIKLMASWPRVVESAAQAHEAHRIAFYLYDLAGAFHGLWNKGKDDTTMRFLLDEDPELTTARLALVKAVSIVIASGLDVMGVEPVEELRG
jgi:arginyl-tRNA synthetase